MAANVTREYVSRIRKSPLVRKRMFGLVKVAIKQRNVEAINKEVEKTAKEIVDKTSPTLLEKMKQEFAEQGCEFELEQFKVILVEIIKVICIGIIIAMIAVVTSTATFGLTFIAGIIYLIYRGWYKFYKKLDEKHALCALTVLQGVLALPRKQPVRDKAIKVATSSAYLYLVKKGYIKNKVLGKMIFDIVSAVAYSYNSKAF